MKGSNTKDGDPGSRTRIRCGWMGQTKLFLTVVGGLSLVHLLSDQKSLYNTIIASPSRIATKKQQHQHLDDLQEALEVLTPHVSTNGEGQAALHRVHQAIHQF